MPVTVRTYTATEINELLDQLRRPLRDHHQTLRLLLSMALTLEHIYALGLPETQWPEWMTDLVRVLQRQVLVGSASMSTHGVRVPTTTTTSTVN